jgi:F420-non-reducing hydrogenase iron-sulfur subunit
LVEIGDQMTIKQPNSISLNSELCSRCYICYSVCPFQAISLGQDKYPNIDIEKCMLCGICASSCPSGVITIQEYNSEALLTMLKAKKVNGKTNLIVACRGSTAPDCKSLDGLIGEDIENQIVIRVPCVGRLPLGFYLNALSNGIKSIATIRCNDDFCRFNNGSITNYSRIYALKRVLSALGYSDSKLKIIEGAKQVNYTSADCVGCGKCVHICSYKAISTGPFGTPVIDYKKCTGCGSCTVVCPHLALEISGYESKNLSQIIENNYKRIKNNKSSTPAILVFACQWAEFGNLDTPFESLINPNISIIEIPCFSKLDPVSVIRAFNVGFDGVIAVTCSDTDCKSKESRAITDDNVTALQAALKMMKLESRFKLYKTYPRKTDNFRREIESFSEIITSLINEGAGHE